MARAAAMPERCQLHIKEIEQPEYPNQAYVFCTRCTAYGSQDGEHASLCCNCGSKKFTCGAQGNATVLFQFVLSKG
eukprot:532744-Amphidinium_carterae.1